MFFLQSLCCCLGKRDKYIFLTKYPSSCLEKEYDSKMTIQDSTFGFSFLKSFLCSFIGESLFTLFASLTYAYHYLMTLTK